MCLVIHQDIKPANVLVSSTNYMAKLCDLGLGCIRYAQTKSLTYARRIIGTPAYVASKCLLLLKKGTEQSDIWYMVCNPMELFSGRARWNIDSNISNLLDYIKQSMQNKILPDTVQSLNELYKAIVAGCLQ